MAIELRQNTEQIVRVGVLVAKQDKLTSPLNPVSGALLNWYFWKYIVKADGSVQNILTRMWTDIPNCAGCYFLTVTTADTSILGPLILYIYDTGSLGMPIFMEFEVVSQNIWDVKYSNSQLAIESQAQKG